MEFLKTYAKEIISVLVPFITWFLNVGIKAKAKLMWGSSHSFSFLVPEPLRDDHGNIIRPSQIVRTESIKIGNPSRVTATHIEVTFNWQPQFLNLWPVRHYDAITEADGRYILKFDNLQPKEEIGIEIMAINFDLPGILMVRSAECLGKEVGITLTRLLPNWQKSIFLFWMMLGLGTSVWLVISLIQFLYGRLN